MTEALVVNLRNKIQGATHRAFQPGMTVCMPWGRGGGKSTIGRASLYLLIAQWDGFYRPGAPTDKPPGVRCFVLMPSLVQARKIHEKDLTHELEGDGPWSELGAKINHTSLSVSFPGGSFIRFVSQEMGEKSLRGFRGDVAFIDEADDIETDLYDAVSLAWFTEPHSLRMRLFGGTPKRGRYGLLYRTHARGIGLLRRKNGERFANHFSRHATCYDFPEFVSARAIEEAKEEIDPRIFAREWECNFDAAQGLVFDMFDEQYHVRAPAPDAVWNEMLVGVDHGWNDPGCILVIGIAGSGKDATAHVIHEVYASHRDNGWWDDRAMEIVGWYPTAIWYCDPSRPDRVADLKKNAGIRAQEVDNSIEAGVSCVANLMVKRGPEGQERARFFVHPSCTNTIREMGLYRRKRDPKSAERVLDDIEDKNNHAMDSMRYPLFARFRTTGRGRNERGAEQRQ